MGCAQCSLFSTIPCLHGQQNILLEREKKDPVNLMHEMSHYRLKFNVIAGKTKKHLYRLFVH
jgi:hypothetical protein